MAVYTFLRIFVLHFNTSTIDPRLLLHHFCNTFICAKRNSLYSYTDVLPKLIKASFPKVYFDFSYIKDMSVTFYSKNRALPTNFFFFLNVAKNSLCQEIYETFRRYFPFATVSFVLYIVCFRLCNRKPTRVT